MINNYIRFMENGPRVMMTEIVCFDSHNQEDIDRVQLELKRRVKSKPVIWHRVYPFEGLPEVGQNTGGAIVS